MASVKGGPARSLFALFLGQLCPVLEAMNSSYICQAWEVPWEEQLAGTLLEAQAARSFLVLGKGGAGDP